MRSLSIYILLALISISVNVKAQSNLDSLWNVWDDDTQEDTNRLKAIYNFAWDGYLLSNSDSVFYYAQAQYDFAESTVNKNWMAKALRLMALGYENNKEIKKTIEYYNKAISVCQEINAFSDIDLLYNSIGIVYRKQANYEKAINYFKKSLEIVKKLHNEDGISRASYNIGIVYLDQDNYEKALEYIQKSLEKQKEINDKDGIANSYNSIAIIYNNLGQNENALKSYRKALRIMTELEDKRGVSMLYNNMAVVYNEQGNLEIALELNNKALKIAKEFNDELDMAMYMSNIGMTYNELGKTNDALSYLLKSKNYYENINTIKGLDETTYELYNVYKKLGQKPEALEMYEYYISIKDSLAAMDGIEKTRQRDFQEQFLLEKQADSIKYSNELILHQTKVKSERIIRFSLIGIMFLVFVFLLLVYYQLKKTSKQKLIIEANQKHITDNITYAKKIQKTLLPDNELIKEFFKNHFVFFQPKDIVGGDFYWFRSFGDIAVVACVDCTGHGVAGGFMSMMGSLLLDKIIQNDKLNSEEILSELNSEIIRVLKQEGSGKIQDGMDLSLCIIDRKKKELHYSGARNGIYVIDDKQVKLYKADMLPAGGLFSKKSRQMSRSFTSKSISLTENNWVIMYTDGYYDQLGFDDRSMGSEKFKEILKELYTIESDKEAFLLKEFNDFKGETPQIDDLLVMGFTL